MAFMTLDSMRARGILNCAKHRCRCHLTATVEPRFSFHACSCHLEEPTGQARAASPAQPPTSTSRKPRTTLAWTRRSSQPGSTGSTAWMRRQSHQPCCRNKSWRPTHLACCMPACTGLSAAWISRGWMRTMCRLESKVGSHAVLQWRCRAQVIVLLFQRVSIALPPLVTQEIHAYSAASCIHQQACLQACSHGMLSVNAFP